MDDLETTNPVEGEDTPDTEVDNEVHDEPQLDDDGNPIEDDAGDDEPEEEDEVDLGALKLKLPKSQAEIVKKGFMQEADYTRKTQELAETRKAFEAQRETLQQADDQELQARGHLSNIQGQLAQFEQVDWNGWRQKARAIDAENFTSVEENRVNETFQQWQLLKDAQQSTLGFLNHKAQERTSKQQQAETEARQAYAKLVDEGTPAIKKAIPDWSRATAAKLFEESIGSYKFTREEMTGVDERIILALSDAAKWRAHQAKTKTTQTIEQQTSLKPAARIGGAAPKTGLDDRLSTEEWVRRRNAKVRQRA